MKRELKFRYAGELAGGLVMLTLVLAVGGIVLTGRTQGWFERRFTLRTMFETPKGSFGLREGNEVIIMNAVAGRVGKIVPTEQGHLSCSFILKERFRQFVRKGSIARVKKKFGVAGDSFVEIEVAGAGSADRRVVLDGDFVECVKDEEIMETARKALENVQRVALPMLKEIQGILRHANGILGLLDEGEGTAGALLNDKVLASDLKGAVSDARDLLDETQGTFRETTRLVKAAQKHWLFRKHVDKEPDDSWLTPATHRILEPRAEAGRYEPILRRARAADDSKQIARNACNLAVCLIDSGQYETARPYVMEARSELMAAGGNPAATFMLEAWILKSLNSREAALAAAERAVALLEKSEDRDGRLEGSLLLASLYCDGGDVERATVVLDGLKRAVRKTESARLKALALQARGRIHLLGKDPEQAAALFDSGAALLREDASYLRMAECLASAAGAYEAAGAREDAADRYFRSGRSLLALGRRERGDDLLAKSMIIAKELGDNMLLQRIGNLTPRAARTETASPEKF